jgi:hypothetical protein
LGNLSENSESSSENSESSNGWSWNNLNWADDSYHVYTDGEKPIIVPNKWINNDDPDNHMFYNHNGTLYQFNAYDFLYDPAMREQMTSELN